MSSGADTRAPTTRKEAMHKRLLITVAFAATVALASAPAALAAANDLNQVIDNLRVWITGLLAALATLLLMIGGVRYLLAAGDPGSHERAKGSIRAALIGYALALLAPLLVTIVQHIVGG
jgi:Type IV secretion system pilin